jgi:hypothetical protein
MLRRLDPCDLPSSDPTICPNSAGGYRERADKTVRNIEDRVNRKFEALEQQLNVLKTECLAVRFYQTLSFARLLFLGMAIVQVWVFTCSAILLAMSADTPHDKDGAIRDLFRVLLHLGKGAEGLLLINIFDYFWQLLATSPPRMMLVSTLARASLVCMVVRIACTIQVFSSLRLAGVLVYVRKNPLAGDEAVQHAHSTGLGLGIFDGYIADKSLDPVGSSECFIVGLCMIVILRKIINARCQQVPFPAVAPAVLWAATRFARGIVLAHSMADFARHTALDIENDNLHGVVSFALQLLECGVGVLAFVAFAGVCTRKDDIEENEVMKALDSTPGPKSFTEAEHAHMQPLSSETEKEWMSVDEEGNGETEKMRIVGIRLEEDEQRERERKIHAGINGTWREGTSKGEKADAGTRGVEVQQQNERFKGGQQNESKNRGQERMNRREEERRRGQEITNCLKRTEEEKTMIDHRYVKNFTFMPKVPFFSRIILRAEHNVYREREKETVRRERESSMSMFPHLVLNVCKVDLHSPRKNATFSRWG